MILAESSYGVLFEGRPARSRPTADCSFSPTCERAFPIATGPGMVVSILAGVNADGTADMSLAGQWYPIAQQVSLSGNNLSSCSWKSPCPLPQGGYYVIEITGGFVNNSISTTPSI